MFKKVVLLRVLADRRKRQTESGIVIRAEILHMVIRLLLGDMARKRAADGAPARGGYRLRRAEGAVSRAAGGCERGVFGGLFAENRVYSRQRRGSGQPDGRGDFERAGDGCAQRPGWGFGCGFGWKRRFCEVILILVKMA